MNLICNITKILDTAQGFWNIFLNKKFQQFFLPFQVKRTLKIVTLQNLMTKFDNQIGQSSRRI